MRTTLTVDDDVAVMVARLGKQRRLPMKRIVTEALRRGLQQMDEPDRPGAPFRLRPVAHGRCLLPSLDDVAGVLAIAERDDHP